MFRLLLLFFTLVMSTSISVAQDVDKNYIRSLAAPGKLVAVVEYYDANGSVLDRKGFRSSTPWVVASPTEFYLSQDVKLKLFGIEPCKGELVVRDEDFAGTCAAYAQQSMQDSLLHPKVLFCRAFISEQNAPSQDVTCYGYYVVPGALDIVDMLEEQLVSTGSHQLTPKPGGGFLRDDLVEAQRIGKQGYGIWADPRHDDQ